MESLTEVGIDILGPLLNTVDGNRYVFVMSDRFSKLTRTVALRHITAGTVASAFLTAWVAAYGPPDCVLSDKGRQMDNSFFRAVMKMLGTRCKYTTPYHPQTNGQVERYNRTLLNQIQAFCEEHPRQCDRLLPALSLASNTCPHRATGMAPFDILIPRRMPSLTVEGLPGSSPLASADGSPLILKRAIIQGLKKIIPTVRASLYKYQARYERNWDSRVRPKKKDLAVGDFVYLRSFRGGHKPLPQALGPFEILNTNGTYFAIDQGDGEGWFNRNDFTPAPRPVPEPDSQPHRLTQAPFPDVNSSDEDPTWEIDRLLAIRHDADNGIVAKVRWATYGRGDDSWEPMSGLPKHRVIRLAKQKKFTLADDAFPTTPVFLSPCPRQRDWGCVAVQQHTDETGAVLVDVRWTSPTTSHEETVPALWAPSLLSEFPEDRPPAHWALGRPAFEKIDAVWGPHTVDLFTTAAETHLPRFLPLSPEDAARGCAAAFSLDWAVENGWVNPPFSFLPQVVDRITSYPCVLTLVTSRWQLQSWWALDTRYCAAREQLNPPYPTFTVAGRTASSPPPL